MLRIINTKIERNEQVILGLGELTLPFGQLHVLNNMAEATKSTFIHLISGQLEPQQGAVYWLDMALFEHPAAYREKWRAKHMGVLSKQTLLIEHLSALDNVLLPYRFTNWRSGEDIRWRATELLSQLGIEDVDKNIAQFHAGQKQSVALVRTLVVEPQIIIADAPTDSLDEQSARNIVTLLRQQADQGKFVLVISADPRLAEYHSNSRLLTSGFAASIN